MNDSDPSSPLPAAQPETGPLTPPSTEDNQAPTSLKVLALGTLGVVYGDIGTSPLYALRECFGEHGTEPTQANVLGILSLVFWSLILVISVKYISFIMRADNRGEGGTMSLLALATRQRGVPGRWLLIILGIFGTSLLYGEGMITPAISVLSAVEGLSVATSALDAFVVPITLVILAGLFAIQRGGTAKVGAIFGPVMVLWFVTLAVLGAHSLVQTPEVLQAISPLHAFSFFAREGFQGFRVLGAVVLVTTGGEALYADMGHFGRRPIRVTWYAVVLPSLLLTYFGQGALLWRSPEHVGNVFYRMAPEWALYPLVALATAAAVIASQALISAAFSLTRNAIQLGFSPRMHIIHTSFREIGQIYVPRVNWIFMLGCFGLVLGFKTSGNLASAYGLAVTAVMSITSILFFVVARYLWRWPLWKVVPLVTVFLVIDLSFFGANLLKFFDGAWFPLVVGAVIFTGMTTWKRGRELLGKRMRDSALPLDVFLADIHVRTPHRVQGNAVFMSGNSHGVPHALLHNLKHNKVLHQRNVLLTLMAEEVPHVTDEERLEITELGEGFIRMIAHHGFMETPNVPAILELAAARGYEYKMNLTTFFLGRETLIASERKGMAIWREKLFAGMSLNARSATSFFGLPPNRVVEMGAQIEI